MPHAELTQAAALATALREVAALAHDGSSPASVVSAFCRKLLEELGEELAAPVSGLFKVDIFFVDVVTSLFCIHALQLSPWPMAASLL